MKNTILLTNKGRVEMIAHRGVSGLEKENTCPAFVAAGVKTYYGIETDVHVTADEKFIVVHDDDLKRVAGVDMQVEKTEFSVLREVRMKDTDGKTNRADLFLPSLDEYIAICKKYDKVSVLELKNRMTPKQVWAIAAAIKKLGWLKNTVFISFSGENLVDLREKYPEATAQFLANRLTDEEFSFMTEHRFDADIYYRALTKEWVERLHGVGLKVNCWTVDTKKEAERLVQMGVDYITSNILE